MFGELTRTNQKLCLKLICVPSVKYSQKLYWIQKSLVFDAPVILI